MGRMIRVWSYTQFLPLATYPVRASIPSDPRIGFVFIRFSIRRSKRKFRRKLEDAAILDLSTRLLEVFLCFLNCRSRSPMTVEFACHCDITFVHGFPFVSNLSIQSKSLLAFRTNGTDCDSTGSGSVAR